MKPHLAIAPPRRSREGTLKTHSLPASLRFVRTHQEIDRRSLELARAVVSAIDNDPSRAGLERARENCRRWSTANPSPAIAEWLEILGREWAEIRRLLLDESETAQRLRQSSPFCGVLTPRERWAIYERFKANDSRTA